MNGYKFFYGSHRGLEPASVVVPAPSLPLHIANTALIIVLLYLLFGQIWVAAGVGLLFGVHPLTVEPIPWIGERKTLLAAFFSLWCLVFYVIYTRKNVRRLQPSACRQEQLSYWTRRFGHSVSQLEPD